MFCCLCSLSFLQPNSLDTEDPTDATGEKEVTVWRFACVTEFEKKIFGSLSLKSRDSIPASKASVQCLVEVLRRKVTME